jgi:hypothetical protein
MLGSARLLFALLAPLAFGFVPVAALHADGGTVRLSQRKGDHQITVFTSPTPVRAGPVDISVFIQNAATGEPVPQARIRARAAPGGLPEEAMEETASHEKATNKLYQDALFDLPQAGRWDVLVVLDGLGEPMELAFEMEVEEALPRLGEMTPWIAWPAAAILLFLAHRWLVERRARRNGQ